MPRKTKIGTEVSHVTCNSDTTFKVKRSKVKVTGVEHIVAASRLQLIDLNILSASQCVGKLPEIQLRELTLFFLQFLSPNITR